MLQKFLGGKSFFNLSSFNFGNRTILYDYNKDVLKGKIVDFAGFDMPVQFQTSITEEHLAVRKNAGAFDVSHMFTIHIHGKDREKFLETCCTGDVKELKMYNCLYSLLPNKKGGLVDDFMISKMPNFIKIVVNAGCATKDFAYIHNKYFDYKEKYPSSDLVIEPVYYKGLIALQGPKAAKVLQKYVKESLKPFAFMHIGEFNLPKIKERALITRSGYTGEDGFEIAISNRNMVKFLDMLLHDPGNNVLPCGLGARDTLRLEAGMCLYGHEIDENRDPVTAGISWAIGKRRKKEGGFDGYDVIKKKLKKGGISQKRVGLMFQKGAIPREHTDLCDEDGEKIGMISSGTFSPSLKKPIAMGYVPIKNNGTKVGTTYYANIRNRLIPCKVVKLPFVPNSYYRV